MPHTPDPIFKDALGRIEWKKIYEREYGVQYSEMALLCLASKAGYHIPSPSVNQIVIPEGNNTAFYIAVSSWEALVDSLNQAYTGHIDKLKTYEKDFVKDGEAYLAVTNKIAGLDLAALSNQELLRLYREYQARLFRYSIFAWTSFILNNYVAERASAILDSYLARQGMKAQKQDILDALFKPQKKAAVLCLQDEIAKYGGKLLDEQFETLFEKYKWLSCLDIHNDPWTRDDLLEMLLASNKRTELPARLFSEYSRQLQISETDLGYLHMAQRFVYIKDARDDYRRQGVYKALPFFEEMAKRMGLDRKQFGYLLEAEVSGFLAGDLTIDVQIVQQRRKAFILYLDPQESPVCLQGDAIAPALVLFGLEKAGEEKGKIRGTVAAKGKAIGRVVIVRGVEDLKKVEQGDILVAVTTHPDYVPAMRRCAAIVTDEGGITSHAAIVAREFGIPCIVGTKNATQVLKDGENIEVDASKGQINQLD